MYYLICPLRIIQELGDKETSVNAKVVSIQSRVNSLFFLAECTLIKPKRLPHPFPTVYHTNTQPTVVQVEMELLLPPPDQNTWGIDFNIYKNSNLSSGRDHIGWVAFLTKPTQNAVDEVRVSCFGDWPSIKVHSNWSTPSPDMKDPRHAIIQVECMGRFYSSYTHNLFASSPVSHSGGTVR